MVQIDPDYVNLEGQDHRSEFKVTGGKCSVFGRGCSRLIEKLKQSWENQLQAVTTLCRFQCGVAEVSAVPSAVALIVGLSCSLC